jgi:hypothetical protein
MKKQKAAKTTGNSAPGTAQPKDDEKQPQPFIALVRDLSAYVYLKSIRDVEVILPWGMKIPSLAVLKIPQKKLGSIRRCDVGKIQLERYTRQRELEHTRALLAKDKVKQ